MVDNCEKCQRGRPSQPEEPLAHYEAKGPWDRVAVDLFEHSGKDYLALVDIYSGYPFACQLRNKTSAEVVKALEVWFMEFGYPRTIVSDHGRQFLTQFEEWCEERGIIHDDQKSSPYNHRANGNAEAAVKLLKSLLDKTDAHQGAFRTAHLHYRNLPHAGSLQSPAELFLGRMQRRGLPLWTPPSSDTTEYATWRLRPLATGERVCLQNPQTGRWDDTGIVSSKRDTGRSYYIDREGGQTVLRNRKFLKPLQEHASPATPSSDPEADSTQGAPHDYTLRRSSRVANRNGWQ